MLRMLRHPDYHRQGAALIVALMVMLLLTGMGYIAVATARQDNRATTHLKRDRQAQYVTESGLMMTMAEVGRGGDTYWTFMKQAMLNGKTTEPSYIFGMPDFQNVLFTNPNGDVEKLDPNISVVMDNPLDSGNAVAGYSEQFCFKSFDFMAIGEVGASESTIDLDNEFQKYASKRYSSTGLLGPIECEGN